MKNLMFGLLLHFYQPIKQDAKTLGDIVKECYAPLFKLFRQYDGKFVCTININSSLLKLLKENGYESLIDDIFFCIDRGIVELVDSTYFHPILPLTPEDILDLQISEDKEFKKSLGIKSNCNGFFNPELAINDYSAEYLKRRGDIGWMTASDRAVIGSAPLNKILTYKNIPTILRSERWSKLIWDREEFKGESITFNDFKDKMVCENGHRSLPYHIVVILDGETFGHHIKGAIEKFVKPLLKDWCINGVLTPIQKIVDSLPKYEENLKASSWSTLEKHFSEGVPFPLWNHPLNENHKKLWYLVKTAYRYFDKCDSDDKHLFLEMYSSCAWWWLCGLEGHWFPKLTNEISTDPAYKIVKRYGNNSELWEAKEIRNFMEFLERIKNPT